VGARQVVRLRRTEEPEAVGQNFDDARAGDLDLLLGELFQDRKHHVLFAHRTGVLDLQLFSEFEQGGGGFVLEILELHNFFTRHWNLPLLQLLLLEASGSREARNHCLRGEGSGPYGRLSVWLVSVGWDEPRREPYPPASRWQ